MGAVYKRECVSDWFVDSTCMRGGREERGSINWRKNGDCLSSIDF